MFHEKTTSSKSIKSLLQYNVDISHCILYHHHFCASKREPKSKYVLLSLIEVKGFSTSPDISTTLDHSEKEFINLAISE